MTNSKIVAAVLLVVVIAACVGAYAVIGGDDDSPSPSPVTPDDPVTPVTPSDPDTPVTPDDPVIPTDPDTPTVDTKGGISATGYSAEIPLSLLRGPSTGVDPAVTVTVSDPRIDITVNDDSVVLRGFAVGSFTITVRFSDGPSSECTVTTADGSSRIAGRAADGSSIDSPLSTRAVYEPSGSSDWSYWTGNTDSPGVTDSVTPIASSQMKELWRVQATVDGIVWKTPGSAVCVGSYTYYYDGAEQQLRCVVTRTGSLVASVSCASDSVYNMAIAYGDGKVFVPTHDGSTTVLRAFDAATLQPLFVSAPISGGEVQGAVTYHDGAVYLGTYGGDYVCIGTDDTDKSRSDEVVEPRWVLRSNGWYNSVPSFFDGFCVIAEIGWSIGGAVVYSIDTESGAVIDTVSFDKEYCLSGVAAWNGRVFIPIGKVVDKEHAKNDDTDIKALVIYSYAMNVDGTFDKGSETNWESSAYDGGTQSIPVIWNGRLYIGGGGKTLGSNEPFNVLDVSADGTMTLAYSISDLQTKGTASLTTAYSASSNGDRVYIYILEYGHVFPGESAESMKGYSVVYCLSDAPGQTRSNVVFKYRPAVDQFAYQSFSISPDGCILIRNDSTLFCYGDVSRDYTVQDLVTAIDRIVRMSEAGEVNTADVQRAEARYASLSESDRAKVTNYADLQALYCTVTFSLDGHEVDTRVLSGSLVAVPPADAGDGRAVTGWICDGRSWNVDKDRVTADIVLTATVVSTYTVSFDSDGGSAVSSVQVVPGVPLGYVPDPVRDGYTFDGWWSASIQYIPQHSAVSSDLALTAHWLKDSTISFDSDGGSSASSIAVTQTKAVGALPTVKRSGYTFTGWFYNDTLYTSETVYPFDHDITLKAGWTQNSASTIDNGKGVRVTGILPEGVTMTFASIPSKVITASRTALLKAAGSDAECYNLGIYGDGVDGSQTFRVDLPVGAAWDGRTIAVHYYIGGTVYSVSGTVSDGVLSVDLTGATSSRGTQMTFAVPPGSTLSRSTRG